jgi:lipoprotein-anchoring transpeptidase ErfK/SrfK
VDFHGRQSQVESLAGSRRRVCLVIPSCSLHHMKSKINDLKSFWVSNRHTDRARALVLISAPLFAFLLLLGGGIGIAFAVSEAGDGAAGSYSGDSSAWAAVKGNRDQSDGLANQPVPPAVTTSSVSLAVALEPAGEPWWVFPNPFPYDGPLTLQTTGRADSRWVEVFVPVVPNGTTGWVSRDDVISLDPKTLIVVDLSDREARMYVDGVLVDQASVAVGAAWSPTPLLDAIVDHVQKNTTDSGVYGSWLFGLNQHSEVLEDFNGGRPAIALHGTNEPWLIGQTVSNGCIRFANKDIERFAAHVELGTQVIIRQ